MDTAAARVQERLQAIFRDGLGTRHRRDDGDGALEVLVLHDRITSVPTCQFLLRERVSRLTNFRHDCYARVREIERGDTGASQLAIISDRVPGTRLSIMLAVAEQNLLPLDIDSALCMIRQLVSAVAMLHEAAPDACHGALAPERIIVTPVARLVIMEHVLGAALEQLHFTPERYWKDLRIALPPADDEPRFNRRSDVVQVGTTALAVLLGRPLGEDEYPADIDDLAHGTFGLGGGFEPLPEWLRSWLARALWLDPSRPFSSAVDAREAFESGLKDAGHAASQDSLVSFLAEYACVEARTLVTPARDVDRPEQPVAPQPPAVVPPPISATQSPSSVTPPSITVPPPRSSDEDADMPHVQMPETRSAWDVRRPRLVTAAMLLVVLTTGGTMAARRYLASSVVPAPATGTLAVTTDPAGAHVVIDGLERGSTPLSVSLNTGAHVLELSADGVHRTIPVTIAANAEASQFIEMPKAAPAVGDLEVRTDPSGAKVSVDGQLRGASPLMVTGLAPGSHTVMLENELGSINEDVTIQPGATASLIVPLKGPQGAPVSGWISITAPAEVQIFENQRLLGSSRTDRIMVAAGRHDVDIVNDALSYRSSQTIQVAPGQVARVKPDWPQGTVAINATPWAEVWLDGQDLGETPVGNTQVPIGTHEIIFRHPQLGEQRQTATVTAATPVRLSVDMRKK